MSYGPLPQDARCKRCGRFDLDRAAEYASNNSADADLDAAWAIVEADRGGWLPSMPTPCACPMVPRHPELVG